MKKFKSSDFEDPAISIVKHKSASDGLSITRHGRLLFSIPLQEEMGINPKDREENCFVKVQFYKGKDKDAQYIFLLQFFTNHPPVEAKYKVYKPKRGNVLTSYFEISRFLKERGLITSVGDTEKFIEGGPIKILEKDIEEHSLVINLKSRFKI